VFSAGIDIIWITTVIFFFFSTFRTSPSYAKCRHFALWFRAFFERTFRLLVCVESFWPFPLFVASQISCRPQRSVKWRGSGCIPIDISFREGSVNWFRRVSPILVAAFTLVLHVMGRICVESSCIYIDFIFGYSRSSALFSDPVALQINFHPNIEMGRHHYLLWWYVPILHP
jgi:hypothetical protein